MVSACTSVVSTVSYPFQVTFSLLGDLIRRVCNAVRNFFAGCVRKNPPAELLSPRWTIEGKIPSGRATDCCALGFLSFLEDRKWLTPSQMKTLVVDGIVQALARYAEVNDFAQVIEGYGFSAYKPENRPVVFEQRLTEYVQMIAQNQGPFGLLIRVGSTNMLSLGLFGSSWWLLDPAGQAVYRTEDQAELLNTVRQLVPKGSGCILTLLQKKAQ